MCTLPLDTMNIRTIFVILISFLEATKSGKKSRIRGVRWWNLANAGHVADNLVDPSTPVYINPSLQPLTRKQRRLVTKNPGTIVAIAKGARLAIEECQFQFKTRRWNCPTSDESHGGSVFGKILKKGCRETSFINAITSAAVTHTIARSCSQGSVYTCSCGQSAQRPLAAGTGDWEWGGCSDNVDFGHKFSKDFVDVVEKGRDLRYMMNLHNNEVGRKHVTSITQQACKCHGMSGSCTIKSCWMRLPTFRDIGRGLKDSFDGAIRVYQDNNGNRERSRSRFKLLPINPQHKPPGEKDLVYFENSPTFCESDYSIGFVGTKGRECNATSIGVDGCDLMCCGRGHTSETYTARERCNCVFHWCCKVTCDICTLTKMRHSCL